MSDRDRPDQAGELVIPHTEVVPMLHRLEQHVISISEHIHQYVPRKPIPVSVKERHRLVIAALGSRCPCCGLAKVLDPEGRILDAEFDHFYSRERNAFEETWLICRSCHQQMRDRPIFTDEFRSYQRRAAAVEGGQLQLILK